MALVYDPSSPEGRDRLPTPTAGMPRLRRGSATRASVRTSGGRMELVARARVKKERSASNAESSRELRSRHVERRRRESVVEQAMMADNPRARVPLAAPPGARSGSWRARGGAPGAAGLALSPFRRLVVAYFSSRAVQLVVIALSLASCGWFVAETYVDGAALSRASAASWRRTSKSIEIGFSLVFLVDYVMSCALARSIAHYALSPIGVIDLLSLAPVVAELPFAPGVTRHFGFVRFMRVLKVVRVLRLHRVMHLKLDAKSQGRVAPRVAGLALSIVGVTFVSAGLVYSLAEQAPGSFTQQPLLFHDAFYFAVVTMRSGGPAPSARVSLSLSLSRARALSLSRGSRAYW